MFYNVSVSIDQTCTSHPALQAAAVIDDALTDLLTTSPWTLTERELLDLMTHQETLLARLHAAVLATTRDFDSRGIAATQGAASTAAWLRERHLITPAEAKKRVKLAHDLDTDLPGVKEALATGSLSADHAHVIATAMHRMPKDLDQNTREVTAEQLLGLAELNDPDQLRDIANQLRDLLDQDGAEPRERDALTQRTLTLTDRGDGTHRISGILDNLAAATLKAGIDPLAAPKPAEDGSLDPRPPGRRRADALLELLDRALRHGNLPRRRGARPHLIITASLDTLLKLEGAPPARTTTGETVTAENLRRLACDANITRILTDPASIPLDVGHRHRHIGHGIWIALLTRDTGCVFPGCTRPGAWTDAHHIQHWADHGPTALHNLALLCPVHHDAVHHNGWDIRMGDDGRPELIPPSWIDSERKPRRNTYWQTFSEQRT